MYVTAAAWITEAYVQETSEMFEKKIDYTYDSDDPAQPRRSESVVHYPNPMAKVSMNNDRSNSNHDCSVYEKEMGL